MKRHLPALLLRKHAEFDGAGRPTQTPRRSSDLKSDLNGYDWLKRIKHARVVRTAAS